MSPLKDAAMVAVDTFVESGHKVAIGSGEMSSCVFQYLRECMDVKTLEDIVCVATSDAAASEAAFQGLPQATYGETEHVDVMFQEVDEVDAQSGAFIYGRRSEPHQPQIMKARLVMEKAKQCIGLIDGEEKVKERLAGSLPVFIKEEGWEDTAEDVDDMFIPNAEIWRRPMSGTADPRGGPDPYVSRDGHNIIDIRFDGSLKLDGEECAYEKISNSIYSVDGVVTHGLIYDVLDRGVVASPLGPRIIEWERESSTLTD